MIKVKQRNIRVFEIDNSNLQACMEFLAKNALLLKDYLIFLSTSPQEELKVLIKQLGLTYFVPNHSFISNKSNKQETSAPKALKIISKPVRSGEEIEHNGDLIVCEDIHNGARVYATGNLILFGNCEGRLECAGEYLILKNIKANYIIFGGEIFSQAMFDKINTQTDVLKLVIKNGDFITIKELK